MRLSVVVLVCSFAGAVLNEAAAQDGAAVFQTHCATCHLEASALPPGNPIPSVETLRMLRA